MGLVKTLAISFGTVAIMGTYAVADGLSVKVGDKMSKFLDESKFMHSSDWRLPEEKSKYGKHAFFDVDGDGVSDYTITARNCGEGNFAFALSVLAQGKVYLDIDPPDGTFDTELDGSGEGKRVGSYASGCPVN